jgi:hypothetical protein
MASRFKPASLCEDPKAFGRVEKPQWSSGHPYRPEDAAAAWLQHQAAYAVREKLLLLPPAEGQRRLPERYRIDRLTAAGIGVTTTAELAELMGESEIWLRRKLNGQVTASLTDLAGWTYHLNAPEVWPVPNSIEELTMPGDGRMRPTGRRRSARR